MVGKALWLLQALGDYPDGVQLAELARRGGFPLSTAHRLAASLVRDGFATFDEPTRRYHLGLKLFALAARVSNAHGFAAAALPILRDLAATTQEAALMSVLEGQHQLYVHYVKGPRQVNVIGEPGRMGPLHNTSMGKVLVAFAPKEIRKDLLATLPLDRDRTEHHHRPGEVRRGDRHSSGRRATRSPTRNTKPAFVPSACPSSDPTATRWQPSPSPRPPSGCQSMTASTSCRSSPRQPATLPCSCRAATPPPADR